MLVPIFGPELQWKYQPQNIWKPGVGWRKNRVVQKVEVCHFYAEIVKFGVIWTCLKLSWEERFFGGRVKKKKKKKTPLIIPYLHTQCWHISCTPTPLGPTSIHTKWQLRQSIHRLICKSIQFWIWNLMCARGHWPIQTPSLHTQ